MRGFALFLLVAGCAIRFVHLDADPHYYGWFGHIIDEGRWVEQARSLAQSGVIFENANNLNRFVAPAFEAASYVSFSILGVDRFAARIFSAICGSALLILLGLHLRRHASPSGLLIGVALVAFQADFVVFSRLAIPEIPAMLGELVVFLVVVSGPPRPSRLFAGGLALAATIALKATTFPLLPIFAVIVLALRDGKVGPSRRMSDLLWFGSGLAAAGLAAALCVLPFVADSLGNAMQRLSSLRAFLEPNSLYAMAALPFDAPAAPVLVPPALGLWVAALAVFADRNRAGCRKGNRLLRSASVWCVGYASAMAIQAYFPARYMVHLLTPLSLVSGYAVTRFERIGFTGLVAALGSARRARGLIGAGILSFPTAVVLAAALAGLLGVLGAQAEQLSTRVGCLVLSTSLACALAYRLRQRAAVIGCFLIFPVVMALLWFAGWALRESGIDFWPHPPYGQAIALWAGLVVAALLVSAAAWIATSRLRSGRGLVAALAAAWVAVWVAHIAPGFLDPHFTVRDASRDLGKRLAGSAEVVSYEAEGLFIDNTLTLRLIRRKKMKADKPPLIVTKAPFRGDLDFLNEHYELVTHYDLYTSQISRAPRPMQSPETCPDQTGYCVGVYQLRVANP